MAACSRFPVPAIAATTPLRNSWTTGRSCRDSAEVMAALPTRNGYAILNFLIRPDARLNGRIPIDLMRAGEADLVLQAARAMGASGA